MKLEVVPEQAAFPRAGGIVDLMGDWPSSMRGRWVQLLPEEYIGELDLRSRLRIRTAGEPLPPWHDGAEGRVRGELVLTRVRDAYCMPKYGAVIDADGRILHSSVEEALYITPTLGRLPFVKREENRVIFDPPVSCEEYERGTVFLPWGALNNYGHFVIDGLAALAAVSEQVLLPSFPPLVPSLAPWQRELLDLFLGDQPRIEVRSDVVRIKDVLFANPMAHFLHKPNGLIRTVRRRILARAPNRPSSTGARLYFSRAGLKKRVMTNEPELEALLKAEGFAILHPERFSVAEQIRMVQESSVIVGATGAALANGIFLPERSAVVEILPDRVMSRWVRSLCDENALRWHGFFCRVVEPVQPTKIEGIDRIVNFDYELPLGPFKGFLESLL